MVFYIYTHGILL